MSDSLMMTLANIIHDDTDEPMWSCVVIAKHLLPVVREANAEAWDKGMKWGRLHHLAPGNGPRGFAANPYRAALAEPENEGLA